MNEDFSKQNGKIGRNHEKRQKICVKRENMLCSNMTKIFCRIFPRKNKFGILSICFSVNINILLICSMFPNKSADLENLGFDPFNFGNLFGLNDQLDSDVIFFM